MSTSSTTLLTVGHGTLKADEMAGLFHQGGIEVVVDIRTAPGSRRSPHVHRRELETWLPAAGIAYHWEPALGGFRTAGPASHHTALRNASFRGYADYMDTPSFWVALDAVLAELKTVPLVVMCSESVWWRCHRRLLADAATLGRATPVAHLMHDGRLVDHVPTDGARVTEDGRLRYDYGAVPIL